MLARGLTLLYVVRLLDHFAFWLGARLDISPTVPDVTVHLSGWATTRSSRLRSSVSACVSWLHPVQHKERSVTCSGHRVTRIVVPRPPRPMSSADIARGLLPNGGKVGEKMLIGNTYLIRY
jgi:hypothetical protein